MNSIYKLPLTNDIEEIDGFLGFSKYVDDLVRHAENSGGPICSSYEEAAKFLAHRNHGTKFSEIYADFEDTDI